MRTREENVDRLGKIIDLLDDGAWLYIDDGRLARLFGADKDEAIRLAIEFAENRGCFCWYDPDTEMCIFGPRRYSESGK